MPTTACEKNDHPARSLGRMANDETFERAANLFRALGDTERLKILATLAQGEACVSELATQGDTLSVVSQRLRVLRAENIVKKRRVGKHVNYALADGHVADMTFNALAHAGEGLAPSQSLGKS
jgi:ArsR family transcriptional regulator, lead/cadmium/zinc/bismuth-responsive transcriptional repressor